MSEEMIFQNYTILCVEDDDGIRKRVVNTLKFYFKEVYEESNGEDGYDAYLEYKPDIIISDIYMPKKNGIELVRKIREKDFDTIIVMLSAYSNEEYLLDLINLHINHYILKPVNSDNLLNGIKKAFGLRLVEKIQFCDDLYFDMKKNELYYKNNMLVLRKRDKEFLLLLYKNRGITVTYSMIEDALWLDRNMSMSALKTFIKEFRQRLPYDIIENITQVGYKLKTHYLLT